MASGVQETELLSTAPVVIGVGLSAPAIKGQAREVTQEEETYGHC